MQLLTEYESLKIQAEDLEVDVDDAEMSRWLSKMSQPRYPVSD